MEESYEHDLISNLPQDILKKISSFLTLKEAVKTSILSPRWNSLWSPRCLHFPTQTDASERSLQDIGTFIRSYDSPDICKLHFGTGLEVVAAKGVQKELHLEFSQGIDTEWKGEYYDLKMERALAPRIGTLETLHLGSVSHLGDEFVSALLANCENLRDLKLENCLGLRSLEIGKQNYGLESLVIRGCPDLELVTVSAPQLRYFSYLGKVIGICLENTSSLIEVMLALEGSQGGAVHFDCEEILSLLASIKGVEVLIVSGWLLEWLCSAGVIYKSLEFQFDRLKELRWIDDAMNRTKRDSLACFLNICPLLQSLVVTMDKDRPQVPCPLFHQHWHEPHLWRDYAAVKADVQEKKHLKSVKISGFNVDNEDELSLVELLHEKAIFLESMTISSIERKSWRVIKAHEGQRSRWTRWKTWRRGGLPSPMNSSCLEFVPETEALNHHSLCLTSFRVDLSGARSCGVNCQLPKIVGPGD